MKNLVLILILLFSFGVSVDSFAQTGGKKHERRGKKRGNFILTQYKSRGHADKFARGNSGRKGFIARLFKKKKRTPWVYKSSGSKRSANRANQYLLNRTRSAGKVENAEYLDHQNTTRSKSRVHGNSAFQSRKHKNR